ncbi:aldolase [Candidatus Falkowbacteria bacterium]|jgi:fructose-bisphosphate aldolase/6-deoxy-5-ketofructose 1-phosphate synthase|nr:aldolase [Candidatus Falkowbacteria bacterium]
MAEIKIPLSVPDSKKSEYKKNYNQATANTGNLLLIAGDQKVEHLNDDFFGRGIAPEDASPEHLFKIAAGVRGGVLATHLGLISQYASSYPHIPYLVKINGKTNLGQNAEKDSSECWWKTEDVLNFKKQSGLNIVGIGYTVYLGGKFEAQMLSRIAREINVAHQNGLIAVLWVYPRGKNIKEEDIHTIAGGAGVAACLDADFAKVKYPYGSKNAKLTAEKFKEVVLAAGRTKIICVGGQKRNLKEMIKTTKEQMKIAGTHGLAIGRNLHQRPLAEAIKLGNNLSEVIHGPKPKKRSSFLGLF